MPSGGTTTADFWWFPGADGLSTTASNWLKGPSIPYGVWTRAPGPLDRLHFDGDLSDADCLIPSSALPPPSPPPPGGPAVPNTYGGLLLTDGYSGVVSTAVSLGVGSLQVDSGTVRQNGSTSTSPNVLTVNATLTWTGGTLNDASVAGEIDFAPGATGVAEPTDEGTVYLGSTLRLLGDTVTEIGSSLEVVSGTYKVVRGLIEVGLASILTLAPVPKLSTGEMVKIVLEKETPANPDDTGVLRNLEKGTVIVRPKSRTTATKDLAAPVYFTKNATFDNAGSVELQDRAQLVFDPDEGAQTYGYYQRANFKAVTQVEAGCSFVCYGTSFVNIDNGHLKLVERRIGEEKTIDLDQPQIVIKAPKKQETDALRTALRVSKDADIQRSDRSDSVPVRVRVEGHFDCNAKSIEMFAERTDVTKADQFVVTGQITIGNDAKVDLWWFSASTATVSAPAEWTLFKSTYVGDGDAITQKPKFELHDPDNWNVALTDYLTNDKKEYRVKL